MEERQVRLQALLDRHPDEVEAIRARWKAHWHALRETCRPRTKGAR